MDNELKGRFPWGEKDHSKDEHNTKAQELRARWHQLRPEIGSFMCELGNSLDKIKTADEQAAAVAAAYFRGFDKAYDMCVELLTMDPAVIQEIFGDYYDSGEEVILHCGVIYVSQQMDEYKILQDQIREEAERDAAAQDAMDKLAEQCKPYIDSYFKKLDELGLDATELTIRKHREQDK